VDDVARLVDSLRRESGKSENAEKKGWDLVGSVESCS